MHTSKPRRLASRGRRQAAEQIPTIVLGDIRRPAGSFFLPAASAPPSRSQANAQTGIIGIRCDCDCRAGETNDVDGATSAINGFATIAFGPMPNKENSHFEIARELADAR